MGHKNLGVAQHAIARMEAAFAIENHRDLCTPDRFYLATLLYPTDLIIAPREHLDQTQPARHSAST